MYRLIHYSLKVLYMVNLKKGNISRQHLTGSLSTDPFIPRQSVQNFFNQQPQIVPRQQPPRQFAQSPYTQQQNFQNNSNMFYQEPIQPMFYNNQYQQQNLNSDPQSSSNYYDQQNDYSNDNYNDFYNNQQYQSSQRLNQYNSNLKKGTMIYSLLNTSIQ